MILLLSHEIHCKHHFSQCFSFDIEKHIQEYPYLISQLRKVRFWKETKNNKETTNWFRISNGPIRTAARKSYIFYICIRSNCWKKRISFSLLTNFHFYVRIFNLGYCDPELSMIGWGTKVWSQYSCKFIYNITYNSFPLHRNYKRYL